VAASPFLPFDFVLIFMVFRLFSLTKFIPVLNVRHLQKGFWSGENREIGDTLSFVQKKKRRKLGGPYNGMLTR